ncbi:MAG: T9SS type A sorting domain-containing protein [Candidatus Jorgensenbacteria bacterium]|nr:T9SS type A sorting domain-containing protein [Candidatus Jorgensenbacteria bacterium]
MKKRISVLLFVAFALFAFVEGVFAQDLPSLIESRNLTTSNVAFSDVSVSGRSWLFTMTAPDTGSTPYGRWRASYDTETAIPTDGIVAKVRVPETDTTSIRLVLSYELNGVRVANSAAVIVSPATGFQSITLAFPGVTGNFNQLLITASYSGARGNRTFYLDDLKLKNGVNETVFESADSTITPPAATTLNTPVNGATGVAKNLTFQWSQVVNASSYRLIAVKVSTGDTVINQGGITSTSYQATGLADTTMYRWAVFVIGQGGSSPSSAEWSFTTTLVILPPNVPTQVSPASGALNASINQTVSWDGVTSATFYDILGFRETTLIDSQRVTTTSYALQNLTYSTVHSWKVRAGNNGGISAYSSLWSFATADAPVTAPTAPVVVFPTDGITISTDSVVIWNRVSGATGYEVRIKDFTGTITVSFSTTDTAYHFSNLVNGELYYVQVKAANTGGSAWSAEVSFKTSSLPIVLPPAPLWVTMDSLQNIQLFTARVFKVTNASSYQYLFLRGVDTVVTEISADTSMSISGLPSDTWFRVLVRAVGFDGPGNWSTPLHFKTMSSTEPQILSAPVSISPADSATVWTTVTLLWSSLDHAETYRVQVARVSDSAIVADQTGLQGTLHQVTSLAHATAYAWRAQGIELNGTAGEWSEWRVFFTAQAGVPRAVLLSSPRNDSLEVSLSLTLSGTYPGSVTSAHSFEAQVAKDSLFANVIFLRTALPNPQTFVSGLTSNTKYWWRMRVDSSGTKGLWSDAWHFVTVLPTKVAPDEGRELPIEFAFKQNYPNPFNPSTTIEFTLPRSSFVRLVVYNIVGQKVRTLINESANPGSYSMVWNGLDDFGRQVSSGIYIYRIEAGDFMEVRKMTFMK